MVESVTTQQRGSDMAVQERISRGFTVSVRQPADPADGYHVTYTPRGPQRVVDPNLFPAIGSGGPRPVAAPFEAVVQTQGEDILVRWLSSPGDLAALREKFEQDAKERVRLLRDWLDRLSALVNDVEGWVKDLGWAVRRVEKPMEDATIGKYKAPALLMQEGVSRVLLEPIGRSAPGTEGVVDLYLMPAYDDIATLYYYDGRWNLHSASPGSAPAATVPEAASKSLSKETLQEVLEEMKQHAA
jgi:hypothetical protein